MYLSARVEERRKLKEPAWAGEVASPRSLSPSLKSKLQAGSVYLGQGSGRSMICKVDLLLPCLPWQPLRAAHWLPPQMSTVWTHTHTHTYKFIYIYTFIHTPHASTASKFLVSLEYFWVCEVLPIGGTWCLSACSLYLYFLSSQSTILLSCHLSQSRGSPSYSRTSTFLRSRAPILMKHIWSS